MRFQSSLVVLCLAILAGCSDGGGSPTTISGVVQKGLFTRLNVQAVPIDSVTGERGTPIEGSVSGQEYSIEVPEDQNYIVEATGAFQSETTGETVLVEEPLRAAATTDGGSAETNVNLATHLVAERVTSDLADGAADFQSRLDQENEFVSTVLGMPPQTDPADLRIDQISPDATPSDPNLSLLLLSASVAQALDVNELYAGGFGDLSQRFTSASDIREGAVALGDLNGVNAAGLFDRARENSGFNLPDVDLSNSPVWDCGVRGCDWLPTVGPTVSVSSRLLYEAEGQAEITVRLGQSSDNPVDVQVFSRAVTATDGEDFVGIDRSIRIPAGDLSASVRIPVVVDSVAEQDETFTVHVASQTAGYSVADDGAADVIVKNGAPAVPGANTSTELVLETLCVSDLGEPSELSSSVCSRLPAMGGLGESGVDAAAVKLDLAADCGSAGQCPASEDWLVDLYLVASDGNGADQAEVVLGQYFYPEDSVQRVGENPDSRLFVLALNAPEARALGRDALNQGWELRLETRLGATELLGQQSLPDLVPVPDTLEAGGRTVTIGDNAVVEPGDTAGCAQGEYALTADFALDGTGTANDTVCVAVGGNSDASIPATLGVNSSLNLFGAQIELPAGHVMLVSSRTGHPLPFGLPTLTVAGPTDPEGTRLDNRVWLHAEGLPFMFRLSGGRLTNAGVEIDYDAMRYVQDPGYSPEDPRSAGKLKSNDIAYEGVSGQSGTLQLANDGISGQVTVMPGNGTQAFPEGELAWQGFTQMITGGEIQSVTTVATDFGLVQSGQCRLAGCEAEETTMYQVSGPDVALDGTGAWLGDTTTAVAVTPRWGAQGNGNFAFSRPDDLPVGSTLKLALPGYRFPAVDGGRVSDYLVAHLQAGAQGGNHALHPRGSNAARDGDYFPAGLSLGPEQYYGGDQAPFVGNGTDLTGLSLAIDNQVDQFDLPGAAATKYVIRPGGVSGVFNVDRGALDNPLSFYGYNLDLDRFAVRLVNNDMDPLTWIDGRIALAGDAGFQVHFENLAMDCSGRFGKANVVYESCDGLDNNGNGFDDENCNLRLSSWRADTELFAMGFTGSQGEAGLACSAGNQLLTLDHQVDMKSLDRPVGLQATWNTLGNLAHQELTLQDSYRLDREQGVSPGFPMAATRGEFVVRTAGASPYGALALDETRVGVPFWNALTPDIRLANELNGQNPVAAPAVLAPEGRLAGLDPNQDNETLQRAVIDDAGLEADGLDLPAVYQWGNTGFQFTLPVYYFPTQISGKDQSRFIGRRQEADLFVLNAGAGINYIDPDRTRLSFGASADIEKLKNINFQVDLNDPDNLARVDAVLTRTGVIPRPVLEPAFSQVNQKVALINDFASQGLEDAMRAGLERSLDQAGDALPADPFEEASKALGQIKSLPQQVTSVLDTQVRDRINGVFGNAETSLRSELENLETELSALPAGASDIDPLLQDQVATVRGLVGPVYNQARALRDGLEAPMEQGRRLADQASAAISELQSVTTEVRQTIQQTVAFTESACEDGDLVGRAANGLLDEAKVNLNAVRDLLTQVQGSQLLLPLFDLAANDPAVRRRLTAAETELRTRAEELTGYLDTAEQEVLAAVCNSGDTQTVMARVNEVLGTIEEDARQLTGGIDTIKSELARIENLKTSLDEEVVQPLAAVKQSLDSLSSKLQAGLESNEDGDNVIFFLDRAMRSATDGKVQSLVDTANPDTTVDLVGFVFTTARNQLNTTYGDLRSTLLAELESRLPGAYYTPEQLRQLLVGQIMSSGPVASLRRTMNAHVSEIQRQVNELALGLTDQINLSVKSALAGVESEVNDALDAATAQVRDVPLQSAGLDGYGVIAGDQLERAHIGAQWSMEPAKEGGDPQTFNAALDAVSWSANNKAEGCEVPSADSRLDVTISAGNIPARLASAQLTLKKVYLGFTLAPGADYFLAPRGVYGGLNALGDIGFQQFVIYDPGFVAGVGDKETYIGARAGAVFSEIQAEVAFLAGRTCNQDVLVDLDPEVAQFIPLPPSGFFGAYARGAASIPIIAGGCPLTVGAAADFGAWALAGPPATLGGLVGGGAYGRVACVGALRGQVKALGQVDTDGNMTFMGEGFGAAGVGSCEPQTWTSRSRSRDDSWCATGDALFRAGYDNGWSIYDLSAGAVF